MGYRLAWLAPVAIFCAGSPDQAVHFAVESSRTTHAALQAVDACRYFARLLVATLKVSTLHDHEGGQWHAVITDSQAVENATHSPDDQLLGVLAEALFDCDAAVTTLAALRATNRLPGSSATSDYADALVLTVGAEAFFGKEKALP